MTGIGRISRISVATDMTHPGTPTIPLGYMLEAAWPEHARWLGIIGRTRLTPLESDQINFTTWPELREPFDLLEKIFTNGWAADPGEAGVVAEREWSRSAWQIFTDDNSNALLGIEADTTEAWTAACSALSGSLDALRVRLVPTLIAQPVPLARPAPQPTESRTRTDPPHQAAA